MGTVYVATNETTEMDVALKVMSDELRSDEQAGRRFLQEARAASRVRHPGVVRVFDADRDEAGLWMAMELLEGESLGVRLRSPPVAIEELAGWMTQLLDILAHVHEAGVVHRDLKPDNVFLERLPSGNTQVRLLDFGIAKLTDSRLGTHATRTGYALGTLNYLSPEQAMESKDIDARSDIYSVGVILYECLSGRLPYAAESFGELVVKMHSQPPRPLPIATQPLARRMGEVAMMCLAVDPSKRPASCAQVIAAMIVPPAPDALNEAADVDTVVDVDTSLILPKRRWMLAFGAIILVGIVAAVAFVLRPSPAGVTPRAPNPPPAVVPAPPAAANERVKVTVRTDGRRGELRVDGERQEPGNQARWTLDLAPGSHELALHANGKRVASRTIIAEAGKPLSVLLALPKSSETSPRPGNGTKTGAIEAEQPAVEPVTAAQLSSMVEVNKPQLQRCYEATLRERGGKQDGAIKLTVSVAVGANGETLRVTTEGDEFGDMTNCIRSVVERWRYPPLDADLEFSFPLVFQQR